ncbi:MAG: sugar transferase [Syntrophales bacterium]|nr:sugar transferase [Syntrophales bacterium]MCK9528849.1 sugar transferase [Syntrophales bacterium]MDX9921057.1 sugar transferase [Syntrophales bacterium]
MSRGVLRPFVLDVMMLVGSFYAIHVGKYGTLVVAARHRGLLALILVTSLVLAVMLKKYSSMEERSLRGSLEVVSVQTLVMAGLVSLFVVLLGMTGMSRVLIYGTIFLYGALQAVVLGIESCRTNRESFSIRNIVPRSIPGFRKPSITLVLADGCLLFVAFWLATLMKRGEFLWTEYAFDKLCMLFGIWVVTSILSKKFDRNNFGSSYSVIASSLKSALFMAAGLGAVMMFLHYYSLSRGQMFGTVLIFAVLEFGLFVLYYRWRSYKRESGEAEAGYGSLSLKRQAVPEEAHGDGDNGQCVDPVDEKIRHALHFFEPGLYGVMKEHIDLESVDTSRTVLLSVRDLGEIRSNGLVPENPGEHCGKELVINLKKINDIRFLNQYFLLVHGALKPGGWLVGKAHTLETQKSYLMERFSRPLGGVLYVMDFAWSRVTPKLPLAKKVYFAVTKGLNRIVSKAEVLGRLYYCGFEVVADRVLNGRYYFIARKTGTPSNDPDPTYGPLVKLRRSGYGGKPITVYKFRTMHPYSEYLQDYVYRQNQLQEGGKFSNDFRVTEWGEYFRKFWIDELPMLYNWIRGDLQIVGVRPLSRQYLELYSGELRELRQRVKPGLVPPFYADLPKTFEEICASEKRYIESFMKEPFRTQWRYFWMSFWNIVVKRARSA